jgi:dihydroorotate dehydrogenase
MQRDSISLAEVVFKNPLLLAGGQINEENILRAIELGIGGVTIGTYAEERLTIHPRPWILRVEGTNCYVNAYGIRNTIYEKKDFIEKVIRLARRYDARVICSYVSKTPESSEPLVRIYDKLGCDIIEFNPTPLLMGCSDPRTIKFLTKEETLINYIARHVETASSITNTPVSVKFPSTINNMVEAWKHSKSAGARIAHIMNAVIPATIIDENTGKPRLGSPSGTGGLTGECIKPIALAKIRQLSRHGERNIIGTGGVTQSQDISSFLKAGAKIVGFHSTIYTHGIRIVGDFVKYVEERLPLQGL